jgi:hypothetical protein
MKSLDHLAELEAISLFHIKSVLGHQEHQRNCRFPKSRKHFIQKHTSSCMLTPEIREIIAFCFCR